MNWIAIRERLPEYRTRVLFFIRHQSGQGRAEIGELHDYNYTCLFENPNPVRGAVTHWMPLPDPPAPVDRRGGGVGG